MSERIPLVESEDVEYLEKRLQEGEHQVQDFKQTISSYSKIAKAIVAFANQHGGSLFVGIDDDGRILGTETNAEYYRLEDILLSYCKPRPEVYCIVYTTDDGDVLQIEVESGAEKPYASLSKSGEWQIYLRIGDCCERIGKL